MSYSIYGFISFSGTTKAGPFYEQIWSGRKRQTMRKPRKDGRPHVKLGRAFKMYWRVRYPRNKKPVHFIGLALCTGYRFTRLVDVWNDEKNALRDGFINLEEFRDWFWPEWREMPWLKEALEAYQEFKRSSRRHEVLLNWSRRTGKSMIAAFLECKYYVIEWDYPLLDMPVNKR